MAERAVQTAKHILDLEDPEIGLLNYRATAHSAIGVPPSVALMGRLLATRLPVVDEQLKPRDHQDAGIRKSDREAKSTYKRYYDKRHGVRELPPLQTGDPVLLKLDNEQQWSQPSTVVRRDPINRSYIVQTGAGVNYRRNRRHLQVCNLSLLSRWHQSRRMQGTRDVGDLFVHLCGSTNYLTNVINRPIT